MYTARIVAVSQNGKEYIIDAEATDNDKVFTTRFYGIVSKEGADQAVRSWVESLQLTPPSVGEVMLNTPAESTILSAEQIKANEIADKQAQLDMAITEAKRQKEITELASIYPEVAIKKAELEFIINKL